MIDFVDSRTLDRGRMEMLGATSDAAVTALFNVFAQSLTERVGEIRRAVEGRQAEDVRQLLHRLEGSAANFGFVAVQRECSAWKPVAARMDLAACDRLAELAVASAAEWQVWLRHVLESEAAGS